MRKPAAAKAKAGAKAKAAPKRAPRLARAGAGIMKRPARRERLRAEAHPTDLSVGDTLLVAKAHYYGEEGQVAGKVTQMNEEEGRKMVTLEASGTDLPSLFQLGGKTRGILRIHLCPAHCDRQLEAEDLVHAAKTSKVEERGLEGVGWATNLKEVIPAIEVEDENAALRRRMEKLEKKVGERSEEDAKDEKEKKTKTKEKKERKEKGKKKKKKKEDASTSQERKGSGGKDDRRGRGESPAGSEDKRKKEKKGSKKKKKKRSTSSTSSSSDLEPGRVSQKRLFRGTALAHSSKTRRRIKRRAQRYLKKKEDTSTESGTEEDEGEDLQKAGDMPLFGDEMKIQAIATKFPGLLASESLQNITRMISMEVGENSGACRSWPPMAVRYYRQILARKVPVGAMSREMLTHASVIDALLEGRAAQALDICLQRLKGLELQSTGTGYQISQRLEVLPAEMGLLSSRQEMALVQKEQNQERRAYAGGNYQQPGQAGKGKTNGFKDDKGYGKGQSQKGKGKNKDAKAQKQEDGKRTS